MLILICAINACPKAIIQTHHRQNTDTMLTVGVKTNSNCLSEVLLKFSLLTHLKLTYETFKHKEIT